jgi:diguanylate cyclase (GGDEF)-like protein/PAS domain S-box-containing protein
MTSVLIWRTYDAANNGRESQTRLVTSARYIDLLADVRTEYLNEWLFLVSARPPIDEEFSQQFQEKRASAESALVLLRQEAPAFGPAEEASSQRIAARHTEIMDAWAAAVAALDRPATEAPDLLTTGPLQASTDFLAELTAETEGSRSRLEEILRADEVTRSEWEKTAFLVGLLWLVTVGGAVYAARRWVLKPLEDVGQATRLIAAGDVDALAPVQGPAEVASLAADVNRMAMSLINRSSELNSYLSKNLESRTAELEAANLAVRSSEERLNAVIDNAPLILLALDRDGNCTLSKGRGLAACGIEPGAIDGKPVFKALKANEALRSDFERALHGDSFSSEAVIAGLSFESHFAPLIGQDGSFQGVMFVAIEVTERLRAQEALRRSEELYRDLFENAKDIIYTHDLSGRLTSMNKAGQLLSGYSQREIKRKSICDLLSDETRERALEVFNTQLDGRNSSPTYEVELIANDGSAIPLEVSVRLIHDGGKAVGVQGIARDVRERRRAEIALRAYAQELEALYGELVATHSDLASSQRELEEKSRLLEQALELERELARKDSLTGALNHGAIVQNLREIVSDATDGSRAAVVMVDIDDMKAANDMYGHQFGDQVLVQVRELLSRHGAVVGRYGGDEFLVVIKGAGAAAAEAYCQEVLQSVTSAALKDPGAGIDRTILVSMGFAVYPDDAQRMEELIALADSAMYAHKRGRLTGTLPANTSRMGREQAAQLIGEIVPLLISRGDLDKRLTSVCRQIAVHCDYDRVEIVAHPPGLTGPDITAAYPPSNADLDLAWPTNGNNSHRNGHSPGRGWRALLERTYRPVIFDRSQEDVPISSFQADFVNLPEAASVIIAPLRWEGLLAGALIVASEEPEYFTAADSQFIAGVASQLASILFMSTSVQEFGHRTDELSASFREGMTLLARVADTKAGTQSHNFTRLRTVTRRLALELGYSAEEAEEIAIATMLHDVGNYRIPRELLDGHESLTAGESEVVRRHTVWGSRLLQAYPGFALASQIARWHHERWDGEGYPDGLAGNEIPVPVAIAIVADALDTMVNDLVYRQGMRLESVFEELSAGAGSRFSPTVVDALIRLHKRGRLPLLADPEADKTVAA